MEGLFPSGFRAKGKFFFSKPTLEHDLLANPADSLLILYRPNSRNYWRNIPYAKIGSSSSGYLIIDSLLRGEYAFGALDKTFGMNDSKIEYGDLLKIFPNPANGHCTIEINSPDAVRLSIFDTLGNKLDDQSFAAGKHVMAWKGSHTKTGVYFFRLFSKSGNELVSRKIIFN